MFEQDNIIQLKHFLAANNNTEPKVIKQVELDLWSQAWIAAKKSKDISYINLTPHLTSKLSSLAKKSFIGYLSEMSVCSFVPVAEDDAIIEAFDSLSRQNDLAVEHYDYESCAEQFRASPGNSLFALTFWLAARDRAIHSRINCLSCFNLSAKVIDAIANTTPLQVFCACVNSQTSALRNFKLTCPVDDCVCVIDAATETEKAGLIVTPQLCLARLQKTNHCASYSLNFAH